MKNIEFKQLVLFHKKIAARTGGSSRVRDVGLLKSTLGRGDMIFWGTELYIPDERKIEVITHSLICNHGFIDAINVLVLL